MRAMDRAPSRLPLRVRPLPRRDRAHHPWGVFTRYVLNSAASWPEPLALLLMIVLAFLSAVVCYREHLHIGVAIVPGLLAGPAKLAIGWFIELCMAVTNLFMLWWGLSLSRPPGTRPSPSSRSLRSAVLPAYTDRRALTLLFVVERLWTDALFPPPIDDGPARSRSSEARDRRWTSWS